MTDAVKLVMTTYKCFLVLKAARNITLVALKSGRFSKFTFCFKTATGGKYNFIDRQTKKRIHDLTDIFHVKNKVLQVPN